MKKIVGLVCFILLGFTVFGQETWIRGEKITFDLNFAQANRKPTDGKVPFYRYVHFESLPDEEERSILEKAGLSLIDYCSNNTYLVRIEKQMNPALREQMGIDGIAYVTPASKLSPRVKERPIPIWAQANNQVKVIIMGYQETEPSVFEAWLMQQDLTIDFVAKQEPYAEVSIRESQIESLSQGDKVAFMDWIAPPAVKDDIIGRGMHRTSLLDASYPGGRHYDGTGVSVLVRDDGAIGPHIDFEGRLEQDDWDIASGDDHGDMVSGILCGAGNIDPSKKGMASGAFLYVRPYNSNFLQYTMDLHQNNEVVVTSTSYSNGCNDGYTSSTRTIDKQLFEKPTLMHVFSAGNSGANNCGYGVEGWGNITGGHKQAKNCIAVANLNHKMNLASSSSKGPAYDGRIKPDLAAFGAGQKSTGASNKYITGGGTSAAAPGVAGVFAQLIHAYRDLNNAEPEAALIKACLLNGATDMGNKGPDFKFGWGAVNGYRAVEMLEKGQYLSDNMSQGGAKFHTIHVPNNNTQVRFMLYWADPKATVFASKALINDLDFKVKKPDGTTVLPWVLDPSPNLTTLDAPATHGVDHLNNVEQVSFLAQAGDYDVIVSGASVPLGPQKYYVVYSLVEEPLFLAYPNGGEKFSTGGEVRIFWDDYRQSNSIYSVERSYDGGGSWTIIGSTSNQYFIWNVGSQISSTTKIRIKQDGYSTASAENFTIFPKPDGLIVDSVCVDFAKIKWNTVPNATTYDVYTLGDKYMELVGTSIDTFWKKPVTNPLDSFWFSVVAKGNDGLESERALAKFYAGGLNMCQAISDLSLHVETTEVFESICASIEIPVIVSIKNNGITPMSNFDITYSVNGASEVTTPYMGAIPPGQTVVWQSNNPIVFENTGIYNLVIAIQSDTDEIFANNSKSVVYDIFSNALITKDKFVENFSGSTYPPDRWLISGTLGGYSWLKKSVVGPSVGVSKVIMVDNFEFDTDSPVTIQSEVIVTGGEALHLSFDYAYTSYDNNFIDSLKITIADVCQSEKEMVLFLKGGVDLKTIADFKENAWKPVTAADWKHVFIPIKGFNNGTVVVRFTNINGFSNNLYVDNINLRTGHIQTQEMICIGSGNLFSTDIMANSYQWTFEGASAGGTASGKGPHNIIFDTTGEKQVQLIVDTGFGLDTIYKTIQVVTKPITGFSYTNESGAVQFLNTSENGTSYFWDFGDGTTSAEKNPAHSFTNGAFTTCLIVSNDCGSDTTCQSIVVTTSINDIQNTFEGILLAPNPTTDYLNLSNVGKENYSFEVVLFNAIGQVVLPIGLVDLKSGTQTTIDVNALGAGVYWLKLMDTGKVAYIKVVVN